MPRFFGACRRGSGRSDCASARQLAGCRIGRRAYSRLRSVVAAGFSMAPPSLPGCSSHPGVSRAISPCDVPPRARCPSPLAGTGVLLPTYDDPMMPPGHPERPPVAREAGATHSSWRDAGHGSLRDFDVHRLARTRRSGRAPCHTSSSVFLLYRVRCLRAMVGRARPPASWTDGRSASPCSSLSPTAAPSRPATSDEGLCDADCRPRTGAPAHGGAAPERNRTPPWPPATRTPRPSARRHRSSFSPPTFLKRGMGNRHPTPSSTLSPPLCRRHRSAPQRRRRASRRVGRRRLRVDLDTGRGDQAGPLDRRA